MSLKDMEKKLKKLEKIQKIIGGALDEDTGSVLDSENKIEAYEDKLEVAEKIKAKIREIDNMNTMGSVKQGKLQYQGGKSLKKALKKLEDSSEVEDCIVCHLCGGKQDVKKLKKKMYKRKVERNTKKGKGLPPKPKHMRKPGDYVKVKEKKKPGPRKGAPLSKKAQDWQDYRKAVAALPEMKGVPWAQVTKKASKLREKGVKIEDLLTAF